MPLKMMTINPYMFVSVTFLRRTAFSRTRRTSVRCRARLTFLQRPFRVRPRRRRPGSGPASALSLKPRPSRAAPETPHMWEGREREDAVSQCCQEDGVTSQRPERALGNPPGFPGSHIEDPGRSGTSTWTGCELKAGVARSSGGCCQEHLSFFLSFRMHLCSFIGGCRGSSGGGAPAEFRAVGSRLRGSRQLARSTTGV